LAALRRCCARAASSAAGRLGNLIHLDSGFFAGGWHFFRFYAEILALED